MKDLPQVLLLHSPLHGELVEGDWVHLQLLLYPRYVLLVALTDNIAGFVWMGLQSLVLVLQYTKNSAVEEYLQFELT